MLENCMAKTITILAKRPKYFIKQTLGNKMLVPKRLFMLGIFASITACGGGALVNQNSDKQSGEVEFCSVNMTFSSKPNSVPKHQIEQYLDTFGRYIKNNLTGLYSENHHLVEVALCLCKDVSESSGSASSQWNTRITPHTDSINFKKDNIDGIGSSESWDFFDIKSNTKTSFKVIDLSSRSSCQLILQVATPSNSINNNYEFLSSTTETRSKTNKKNTPKERLIQLDALKKDGLITQSEFEIKKKIILDSL